jgi:hypothetical protein
MEPFTRHGAYSNYMADHELLSGGRRAFEQNPLASNVRHGSVPHTQADEMVRELEAGAIAEVAEGGEMPAIRHVG